MEGPIAQRLEQSTHNALVPGSNPGRPTKTPKGRDGKPRSYNFNPVWLNIKHEHRFVDLSP
jgi:hypothetical protein